MDDLCNFFPFYFYMLGLFFYNKTFCLFKIFFLCWAKHLRNEPKCYNLGDFSGGVRGEGGSSPLLPPPPSPPSHPPLAPPLLSMAWASYGRKTHLTKSAFHSPVTSSSNAATIECMWSVFGWVIVVKDSGLEIQRSCQTRMEAPFPNY